MPKTKGAKDKKKRATRGKRGDEETRKRQENTANKHKQAAVGKGGADLTQLTRAVVATRRVPARPRPARPTARSLQNVL